MKPFNKYAERHMWAKEFSKKDLMLKEESQKKISIEITEQHLTSLLDQIKEVRKLQKSEVTSLGPMDCIVSAPVLELLLKTYIETRKA